MEKIEETVELMVGGLNSEDAQRVVDVSRDMFNVIAKDAGNPIIIANAFAITIAALEESYKQHNGVDVDLIDEIEKSNVKVKIVDKKPIKDKNTLYS